MRIKTSSKLYKLIVIFCLTMAMLSGVFAIISLRDYVINQNLDSVKMSAGFAFASFIYYLLLQKYGFSNYNVLHKQELAKAKKEKAQSS